MSQVLISLLLKVMNIKHKNRITQNHTVEWKIKLKNKKSQIATQPCICILRQQIKMSLTLVHNVHDQHD